MVAPPSRAVTAGVDGRTARQQGNGLPVGPAATAQGAQTQVGGIDDVVAGAGDPIVGGVADQRVIGGDAAALDIDIWAVAGISGHDAIDQRQLALVENTAAAASIISGHGGVGQRQRAIVGDAAADGRAHHCRQR